VQKQTGIIISSSSVAAVILFILFGTGAISGSQITGIEDIEFTKTDETSYTVMFDVCMVQNDSDIAGVLVNSEMEYVVVPVDSNVNVEQCQQYGTNIHTNNTQSVVFWLFSTGDFSNILDLLEKQLQKVQDLVVSYEQELLQTQKTEPENIEKIDQLKKQLNSYNEILASTKNSFKAIRGME